MRTVILLPLAFALAHSAAWAGPQSNSTEPEMSAVQVVGLAPGYKPRPAEIDEIKGVYALDNGMVLKISHERRRLFAQLGERQVAELVAVGANRYEVPGQRMTIEYHPIAFGDEVVLTYPADLNVAGSPMVTVRLAQR
jgi:hypothetical protein